jgi:biotin transport system substrate-specific component
MDRYATTYADALRPTAPRLALAYDTALILGGSLFVALTAQVAIRLPFSPVPVTAQTLAVLLVGALLGSRRGALTMLAYLGQGLMGLPVFAAGAAGPAYALGPTGGYLAGFVAAAYLTGWLAEHGWDRHLGTALLAMLAGNVVIYSLGLPWLSHYAGAQTLAVGLLPYLAGDALKLALAAAALPAGWRLLRSI